MIYPLLSHTHPAGPVPAESSGQHGHQSLCCVLLPPMVGRGREDVGPSPHSSSCSSPPAQRGEVTCPRSHSKQVLRAGGQEVGKHWLTAWGRTGPVALLCGVGPSLRPSSRSHTRPGSSGLSFSYSHWEKQLGQGLEGPWPCRALYPLLPTYRVPHCSSGSLLLPQGFARAIPSAPALFP